MSSPSTPIISSFAGADENPLSESGLFQPVPVWNGQSLMRKVSNQIRGVANDSQAVYRNGLDTNQEVYCTISDITNLTRVDLYARMSQHNTSGFTNNMIFLSVTIATGAWELTQDLAGSETTIDSGTQSIASGDGIWLQCVGDAIKAYHRASGVWTEILSAVDSGNLGGGFIAWGISSTNPANSFLDDVGGGNIDVPVPAHNRRSEEMFFAG